MHASKLPLIEDGFQVFAEDGGEEFGAVRYVTPDGRPEVIVYVENLGDATLPLSAVTAVHSGKVVVNVKLLPESIQRAIAHAHDRESS